MHQMYTKQKVPINLPHKISRRGKPKRVGADTQPNKDKIQHNHQYTQPSIKFF